MTSGVRSVRIAPMPIDYAFDPDLGLLAVRYSGSVRTSEIVDAMNGMGELASQCESYAVLLLFEPKVDLSAVDVKSLKLIKQSEQEVFKRLSLRRRASAGVLNGSPKPNWSCRCGTPCAKWTATPISISSHYAKPMKLSLGSAFHRIEEEA